MTTVRVRDIVTREPVSLYADQSIHECAKTMTELQVSSVVIYDHVSEENLETNERNDLLAGIVTDRDLRVRVLADAKPLDTPIKDIMSSDLVTHTS